MARVVLIGNLAQLTGGVTEFTLSATSVKQLYQQLAALHPELGPHLQEGVAVAIDGQIYQDSLLEPIGPDSEVFILPQIAGGRGYEENTFPSLPARSRLTRPWSAKRRSGRLSMNLRRLGSGQRM
jgi:sulfur-carrier protein